MLHTSFQTRLLAEQVQVRFPSMDWRRALTIARFYYDPQRKPVNARGAHSDSQADFIGRLVAAHVRHNMTEYERLYQMGYDKVTAREVVRPVVGRILAEFRKEKVI